MTPAEESLYQILKEARHARKGDYRVYEKYKHQIENLDLNWVKKEDALRSLVNILRV